MIPRFHSSFTPSKSDRQTLESLFVARADLAERILESIRYSATTGDKHQWLLIGPRGIGKTHLMALLYHRVRNDKKMGDRLMIAWMPEEPYLAGYPDLLLTILQVIEKEYSIAKLGHRLEEILNLGDPDRAETALEQLLLEALSDKTLLLIAENLDDLLKDLKDQGQRKLRAFLQNHPVVTTVATATSLVGAVAERKKTFFGFFRLQILEPFNVGEALDMLIRLAEHAGNRDLADALGGSLGLARVRAVHYLAGGNPRVYALFYDFLSRDSLDNLVKPFMGLMEELTPYYQARMSKLAPLQRRIIDILRRLRGAATVKEIARQAMSSSQSISSQLGQLRELGYVVQADSLGRSNYYELREPLMRLCLEVKDQHSRTVELFVQFLRVWYSDPELEGLSLPESLLAGGASFKETIERARLEIDPVKTLLEAEFYKYANAGNFQRALAAAEAEILRNPDDKNHWIHKARCLGELGRDPEEILACWVRVSELDPDDWFAWHRQDLFLVSLNRFEEAQLAAEKAWMLKPDHPLLTWNLGSNLMMLGLAEKARLYLEKSIKLRGEPKRAIEWDQMGINLWQMGKKDDAINAFARGYEEEPRNFVILDHLFGGLQFQGKYCLDLKLSQKLANLMPEEPFTQLSLSITYWKMGQFDLALEAVERALSLDPGTKKTGKELQLYRSHFLLILGRYSEAAQALEIGSKGLYEEYELLFGFVKAHQLMSRNLWKKGKKELEISVGKFKSRIWSDKSLWPLFGILYQSRIPSVWKRFISTWLEVFGRHGELAKLGKGLVASARAFCSPLVSDGIALAWVEVWQELAGELEEMALPLRLVGAAANFKAERDPEVLLGLPQEERELLEPWLTNMFKEEKDDIDRTIERLIASVEQWCAREAEEARKREFWQAPAPAAENIPFGEVLAEFSKKPTAKLLSLLPDRWHAVNREEAEVVLKKIAVEDENGAKVFSRKGLRVLGLARRSLTFCSGHLYQVHLVERGRLGALDVLIFEKISRVLDGTSNRIFALIDEKGIVLQGDQSKTEYVRFFVSHLRIGDSRFHIFDNHAEMGSNPGLDAIDAALIQPFKFDRYELEHQPVFKATYYYGDRILKNQFRLKAQPSGMVEMLNHNTIADGLPVLEEFDGPIRFAKKV